MAPKFLNPHTCDLREISAMDDFPAFRSSRDAFVSRSHTIRGFESRYDSGASLCPPSDVAATQEFGHEFSRDQGSQEEISSQSYEYTSTGHDLIASSLLHPRDVVRMDVCGPPSLFSNNIGAIAMELSPADSPVVSSFEQMDAIAPADTFRFIDSSTPPASETREVSPGASLTTDFDALDDTDDECSEDHSTDIAPSHSSRSTGTRSPSLTPSASSSHDSSLAMPSPQATCTASRNVQIPASMYVSLPLDSWSCPYCNYVQCSDRKPELNRHIISHFRSDNWACHLCSNTFSRRDALKRHVDRKICQKVKKPRTRGPRKGRKTSAARK